MLSVYVPHGTTLERIVVEPGSPPPDNAVWIDMVTPTVQEDKLVEQMLGIAVPTREEMQEIEVSSRLYVENGARYMTATLMCQSDTPAPKTTAVTFILSGHRLATVRYDDPRPFAIVEHKLARTCPPKVSGESVLMDLLDAVIDRSADILERIGAEIDQVSHSIFEPEAEVKPPSYNDVLKALGRKGDLTSKVRESLVSIGRLLLVSRQRGRQYEVAEGHAGAVAVHAARRRFACPTTPPISPTRSRSCSTPCSAWSTSQQNNIIKIFSVAAVVLMPPTLVASIYGMNFKHMPELEWIGGYPFALLADAARRRASVPVFQVAEVAVSWAPRGAHTHLPGIRARAGITRAGRH